MIRQTFPNRLAAGGYWAICLAGLSRDRGEAMREQGIDMSVVGNTPQEIYTRCGIGAFEYVVNCYMSEGAHIKVAIQFGQPQPEGVSYVPPLFDRQGNPIDVGQWRMLHGLKEYRRVALWENDSGDRQVSTIWTGFDPSGRGQIFETIVYSPCLVHHAHLHGHIRAHTEAEAMACHHALVAAVRAGQI